MPYLPTDLLQTEKLLADLRLLHRLWSHSWLGPRRCFGTVQVELLTGALLVVLELLQTETRLY